MAVNEPDAMDDRRPTTVLRWIFEDRSTGRIVIGQAPNLWLWIFLAALVLSYFIKSPGPVYTIVKSIQFGSLAVWAFDELVRGVNPWRRFLGVVTLGGLAFFLLGG